MQARAAILLVSIFASVPGCRSTEQLAIGPLPTGVEWSLIELEGAASPPGAGGRPATLTPDADDRRASGFTGCNQFGGGYILEGEVFRFTPLTSTRMACDTGMDLERRYTAALDAVRSYRVQGDTLVLLGEGRELARYVRR